LDGVGKREGLEVIQKIEKESRLGRRSGGLSFSTMGWINCEKTF